MVVLTDNLTKEQRSYTMSRIRSRWTKEELLVHNFLKGHKIKHKMHPKMPGSPDILIEGRIAVFVHGCFWHGCRLHYKAPKSNVHYWNEKILKNIKRDKGNIKALKVAGYKVVVVWEHEVKSGKFKEKIGGLVGLHTPKRGS